MFVGILAAGEGSRLKSVAPFKPLIKVGNIPLLERTLAMVKRVRPEKITIIFNELEREMDFSLLPSLNEKNITYFFKTTPSSLHSLYEVMRRSNIAADQHIIFSMVDSILRPEDFDYFAKKCQQLAVGESAVMTTSYIEDEKPLTLQVDTQQRVVAFQTPLEESTLITSGMYCFAGSSIDLMQKCIDEGVMKMRNFLTRLVEQGNVVRSIEVKKSLDIDRPEDIVSAERFLGLI